MLNIETGNLNLNTTLCKAPVFISVDAKTSVQVIPGRDTDLKLQRKCERDLFNHGVRVGSRISYPWHIRKRKIK